MRTSNIETRGAGRQETNTSPFKAIKYKDITFLSLRKPLSQDMGLGRPLFSAVQPLSGSQAQKLGGNWGPAEPSLPPPLFFFKYKPQNSLQNELPDFLLIFTPTGFELGFPGVPSSLPHLSLHGRIYVKHSSCGTQTTFYTTFAPQY